jgi:hypothetical protein
MSALVTNDVTEHCLRECLKSEGYNLSPRKAYGQTGVDILASQGGETIHIEVIGFKESPPARSKDFYEVFFRAMSRIGSGAKHSAIALPCRFERGLPARAGQYGQSWIRIGQAFPELEIWLVDTEAKSYRRTLWSDWNAF